MKKHLPWIVTAAFAVWIVSSATLPGPKDGVDYTAFGKLPAIHGGRVQPFDSIARNSLLVIQGKQTVTVDSEHSISAIEWAAKLMMKPEEADEIKVIQVTHPELKGMFGFPENAKYFSFNQLRPGLGKLQEQIDRLRALEKEEKEKGEKESDAKRTPFEKQCLKLYTSLRTYISIRNCLKPEQTDDFTAELKAYQAAIPAGVTAVMAQNAGKPFNQADLDHLMEFMGNYDYMANISEPLIIPPAGEDKTSSLDWVNIGASLRDSVKSREINPVVTRFAAMATAYHAGRYADFNGDVLDYGRWFTDRYPVQARKCAREFFFNHLEPFYKCMTLYVLAGLLACFAWLNYPRWSGLTLTAFRLTWLAFIVHTLGLIMRMVLEGRPPVTNLYSSAIFIGWGAVLLGLILHSFYRDGIGLVVAGCMGFTTLVIAHHLSLDGDTMEMMRAVLDTNFWLATHVVAVTTGYASTFVAGFLGLLFILRGFFTRTLSRDLAQRLGKMMYGIVCFAALFSFVGTVLGGIWADQSWGRFWGWDPKENGALIIVIWNAVILHARWGGLVRERGIAAMTVFGNIVTSFSWFGVNMLGIGLHSYGFMDQAFYWLMFFDVSQLVIIGIALLPLKMWGSFHDGDGPAPKAPSAPPARAARAVSAGV